MSLTVSDVLGSRPGPGVWLAGDPADLGEWLARGAAGIVTNTVVQRELAAKYGGLLEVTRRYLDITDKLVVIEVEGHTTEELLEVSRVFTALSPQIAIKIPCTAQGLGAFGPLADEGVTTFCTTVFSLGQAAAAARAGATHVLPFCEPIREMGGDPGKLVRDCAAMFAPWRQRPFVTAALVRSVETATAALAAGADGIIVFWPIFRDLLEHPLTATWNDTFAGEWRQMQEAGLLEGVVRQG
ncbi:MAG: hypothetical protein OXC12_13050 [Spirochaetaceae bacterium]|nr:hypothetical protein [Spirochaetaceae bacterium]